MKLDPSTYSKYLIKRTSPARAFVTSLNKNGAILPVLLLEATVTGGRTYQAYKRDGFVEARERVTEESLGAIFWLFGATIFAALFDKIGQKFMKIPKNMPDVGRDELRGPFNNFVNKIAAVLKLSASQKEAVKTNLARFSVGKTAASLITACLFIGYVVPKLNQAITKHLFGKMNQKDPNHEKAPDPYTNRLTLKDARAIFSAKGISINAVENFKASMGKGLHLLDYSKKSSAEKNDTSSKSSPSFKSSADSLLRIVQNFQTNDVWKLMGTDVGTVTGRTANARNKDERIEIMFRDISSIYFYCFSMPAIVAFMNKKDAFKGMNTKLNSMTAMEVHNYMVNSMADAGLDKMSPQNFKSMMLGKKLDSTEAELLNKAFPNRKPASEKRVFFGLFKKKVPPVYDSTTLENFFKIVDENITDKSKAERIKLLAEKMSKSQPLKEGLAMITGSQAEDMLKGGLIREQSFLQKMINHTFENFIVKPENYDEAGNPIKKRAKKLTNPLTDSYRYISQNEIEDRRKEIINYVKAIINEAENKKQDVDFELLKKMNRRNMTRGGLFMLLAMGVSSLFLSTIIPKVQYYITYKRTGKHSFPGTENIGQDK